MPNKTLSGEMGRGLPGPLYYVWSEESGFLEETSLKFVEIVLSSGPREFNYDVFDSTSEPRDILSASSTLPVMAERRLVVLKDFHLLTAEAVKKMTAYFDNPSESTCMLVLAQKAPRASLKVNWRVYSLNIKESEIPAWLRHRAAEKGIRLTNDAVEYLIEFVGYDTGLLLMEIDKLALSGNRTITGDDIMATTSIMRKYTPFDLIDSLISGQKTRTFMILKTMLGANVMEAPVILGTLNWHFKQFYTLWLNKGKRTAKMREKTYRTLVKHLDSYKETDFYHIFRSLHEADLGVKTSGRPGIVLEVLLIKLLQREAWN